MRTASCYSRGNRRPDSWPAGQDLTGHMRRVLTYFTPLKIRAHLPMALALVACAAMAAVAACGGGSNTTSTSGSPNRPGRGGAIVASLRTDPRSFNRYFNNDVSSDLVAELTHARLL